MTSTVSRTSSMIPKSCFKRTTPLGRLDGCAVASRTQIVKSTPGMAIYDEHRHRHHRYVYLGHDPAVYALGIGAIVQWALGYPARAIGFDQQATTLARRLQHAPSLAQALSLGCELRKAHGDVPALTLTATALRKSQVGLGTWLERARATLVESFANGITNDRAAVSAAITTGRSNAQTQGQITKLKLVKRQMYGRGKLDLLQARLVSAN
jgi:hypothetical protein